MYCNDVSFILNWLASVPQESMLFLGAGVVVLTVLAGRRFSWILSLYLVFVIIRIAIYC